MRKESLRIRKKSLAIVIAFLLLPTLVQARYLGTVSKGNYAEVEKGQTAEFTILFWNIGNSSYPVVLNLKQAPKKWMVMITPEEFMLNISERGPPYEEGAEYIGLPGIGDVKATPVKILVKVPKSARPGVYEVLITAIAGAPSEGISILQERTFRFNLNVIKTLTSFESSKNVLTALNGLKIIKEEIGKSTRMFSLILSTISILVFSFLIYKYA